MTKARWIGLAAGIVLVLALFGVVVWQGGTLSTTAGTAFAQAPTTTPTAKNGNLGQWMDAFWQAFAKRLGISVDDAKSKAQGAEKDVIDQMVKDGKLTQAQADKLKQAIDSGQGIVPFFGHGRLDPGTLPNGKGRGPGNGQPFGGMMFRALGTDELEAVAKVVKLTPADLQAQFKAGKTLADVAKAQGVTEDAVKQSIIDTAKARYDRLVADGLMTKDQADKAKANLDPAKIDLTKIPFRGGTRGPNNNNRQAPNATPTPRS